MIAQRRMGNKGGGGWTLEKGGVNLFLLTYTDCLMFLSFVSEQSDRYSWQPKYSDNVMGYIFSWM